MPEQEALVLLGIAIVGLLAMAIATFQVLRMRLPRALGMTVRYADQQTSLLTKPIARGRVAIQVGSTVVSWPLASLTLYDQALRVRLPFVGDAVVPLDSIGELSISSYWSVWSLVGLEPAWLLVISHNSPNIGSPFTLGLLGAQGAQLVDEFRTRQVVQIVVPK